MLIGLDLRKLVQIVFTAFFQVKWIFGHMAKNIESSNSRLYKDIRIIRTYLPTKFYVNRPNNKGVRAILICTLFCPSSVCPSSPTQPHFSSLIIEGYEAG